MESETEEERSQSSCCPGPEPACCSEPEADGDDCGRVDGVCCGRHVDDRPWSLDPSSPLVTGKIETAAGAVPVIGPGTSLETPSPTASPAT